jgi:hypothetical protein
MDPIVAWALAFMLSWSPPGRSKIKDAIETPEEGRTRYAEIARAAANVAFDPTVAPFYRGPHARSRTLAVMLSVAHHESGFRKDVDLGKGPLARGSGTDSCLLQIRVGKGTTAEGWTHADLIGNRDKCFRAGAALIRRSMGSCSRLGERDSLSQFANGHCVENDPTSHALIDPALRVPTAPSEDNKVLESLAKSPPSSPVKG